MNRNLARILLASAGVIWGFGFIINKYILDSGWDDSQLLFVRFFTATIFIFLIFMRKIVKTDFKTIQSGIFLGVFLYLGFYFQTWGLENTNPSNNALITAGYIVLLPLIIYVMERKRVHNKTIIAGIITLIGISLISVDFESLSISFGDTLTFIGALFYSIHIYFLGKIAKKKDPVVLMAFQLLFFSVVAFIVMQSRTGFPMVDFSNFDSYSILLLAIGIGFFASFLGFVFQSIGQKNTNEAEAAILISTESVFGPVFAIIFYNDPFNLIILLGIVLVFGGIVLSEMDIVEWIKKRKLKS